MEIRFKNPEEQRAAQARKRLAAVKFLWGVGFSLILLRALGLMLKDNQQLETIAMQQYRAAIQKETDRGRILDRRGRELAINVPAWSLYADPKYVEEPRQTARSLAPPLRLSYPDLLEKLSRPSRFVWLQRKLDADQMEKIARLKLPGIGLLKTNKRFYPNRALAGHVLGAVGIDSQPLGGIELAYDRYLLSAAPGGIYRRDARGRLYLAATPPDAASEPADVYLTLDKNIQFFAETALHRAVQEFQAKGGLLLVMEPASGDLLALANEPGFNPNHFEKFSLAQWRNRAVTDVYEPGSTFKIVPIAAAIEEKALNLQERIDCEGGRLMLAGGHILQDHRPYQRLTVQEILQVSSNIGAYKIAQRLPREKMEAWIRRFGFGQTLGIDFPGEVAGLLAPHQTWRSTHRATLSFGQGIGVTPLQILSAYALIANQGWQMRPHLVEKVVTPEGRILYQAAHQVLRRPVEAATAQHLTHFLRAAVLEGGTGFRAEIEDYPAAGKTGTAQKPSRIRRGYAPGKYVASFVGFAPFDRPQLAMLVLIDEPQEKYYGGETAAPLFREVMLAALQYLGVPPRGESERRWEAKGGPPPGPIPLALELRPEGKRLTVPDFQGASLREVLRTIAPYPVTVDLRGRGLAVRQDPKPGTTILAGGKIYVEFRPVYR